MPERIALGHDIHMMCQNPVNSNEGLPWNCFRLLLHDTSSKDAGHSSALI